MCAWPADVRSEGPREFTLRFATLASVPKPASVPLARCAAVKVRPRFFEAATPWSRPMNQYYTGISVGSLTLLATRKVLLAGGSIIYGKASSVARADLYDPATNAWVGTVL